MSNANPKGLGTTGAESLGFRGNLDHSSPGEDKTQCSSLYLSLSVGQIFFYLILPIFFLSSQFDIYIFLPFIYIFILCVYVFFVHCIYSILVVYSYSQFANTSKLFLAYYILACLIFNFTHDSYCSHDFSFETFF